MLDPKLSISVNVLGAEPFTRFLERLERITQNAPPALKADIETAFDSLVHDLRSEAARISAPQTRYETKADP